MVLRDLRIGEFTLGAPVGQGGFSRVWLASHPQSSLRFVVKVLRGEIARDAASRDAFVREADAVARLWHPNIVALHDFGEIGAAVAESWPGGLDAATPYLVTEYYERGSLGDGEALPWARVHEVLVDTLHALAHAHARGVLHLDVKPQNLLQARALGGGTRTVVADFGTAAMLDRFVPDRDAHRTEGTPMYMAPERLVGGAWEQGPWTDIYAVAVTAWVLLSGRVPFATRDVGQIATAHLREGVPPLPLDIAVPAGFHTWMARASHREPSQRYVSAAEALAALATLVPMTARSVVEQRVARGSPQPDATDGHALAMATTAFVPIAVAAPVRRSWVPAPAPQRLRVAPPALAAITVDAPLSSGLSLGAGLLGRREPPLVGRADECSVLWGAFSQAVEHDQLRVVLLEGPAGAGKSRLARWLCEAAAEFCGALALAAVHSEAGGAADGVAPMLRRGLGARVTGADELLRWAMALQVGLGAPNLYEAEALAAMVAGSSLDPLRPVPWRVRITALAEQLDVVVRLLRRLAATRPVVVWIDDVQWATDALSLIESLAAPAVTPFGLTLVVTARAETRSEQPAQFARIDALGSRAASLHLRVAPQSTDELVTVLRSSLALDVSSARAIAVHAAGSPLLGLQLVQSLHASGALERQKTGWTLADPAALAAPPPMLELWQVRLDHALDAVQDEQRGDIERAIDVSAALGSSVTREAYASVTRALGPDVAQRALALLISHHLAVLTPEGWMFAHGLLHEAILQRIVTTGRAADVHGWLAEWYDAGHAGHGLAAKERAAQHLLRAGRAAEAFDAMVVLVGHEDYTEASAMRMRVDVLRRAWQSLPAAAQASREAAMIFCDAVQVVLDHPERPDHLAQLAQAQRRVEELGAPLVAWDLALFSANFEDGYEHCERLIGEYAALEERARALGDRPRQIAALVRLAVQYEIAGRPADALRAGELATRLSAQKGGPVSAQLFDAYGTVFRSCFDLGDFARGLETARDHALAIRQGATREQLASYQMSRAECLIRCGEFGAAARALDEALEIAHTTSTNRDILCHVHRTALFARSGEAESCIEALESAMGPDRGPRVRGLVVSGIGYTTVALAALGRLEQWDQLVPEALEDARRWGMYEPVMLACISDAALALLRRGDTARAAPALEFAELGWVTLGHAEEVARIESIRRGVSDDASAVWRPFLDAVRCNVPSCPDWLLDPALLVTRAGS